MLKPAIAYMVAAALLTLPATTAYGFSTLEKGVAAATTTAMYSGRDKRFLRLADIGPSAPLTYLTSAEGWVQVADQSGQKGWVDGTEVYLWDPHVDFSQRAAYGVAESDWRMRYFPVREVVRGGDELRLRSGPSIEAEVKRYLMAGDRMKLLAIPGGEFVRVMVADGDIGWVSRKWIKPVPEIPDETMRLVESSSGVLHLEVSHEPGASAVQAADLSLVVSLPVNAGRQGFLQIGQYNIADMQAHANGLTLHFEHPALYRVLEQTERRTVIEIRPRLERVAMMGGTDRQTYRFYLTGAVTPAVLRDGGDVLLQLPGAILQAEMGAVDGVALQQSPEGLTARLKSDNPFALRTGDGFVDLIIYTPGLQGKRIVLDPGHGGPEPGAIGPTGLEEKEANLAIARQLQRLLTAAGAQVTMTRVDDTRCATPAEQAALPPNERLRADLDCRATLANKVGADLFLSVHANSSTVSSDHGTETYWSVENANAFRSRILASVVQDELVKRLGTANRGVKQDMYYVTRYAQAPAVIAEVAFVGHPDEEALLRSESFRQKAAEALLSGLSQFFAR